MSLDGSDASSDDCDHVEQLELLQRLLSERFGDRTSFEARSHSPATSRDAAATSRDEDATAPTPFPLFSSSYWAAPGACPSEGKHAPSEEQPKESKKRKRDAEATFELPLVRLVSPEPVYHGPGRGRILAVEDEDKSHVKARRRQIADTAVSAAWLCETSSAEHWSPKHGDIKKLSDRALLASQAVRLAKTPIVLGMLSAAVPHKSATVRKLRLRAYPFENKPRLGMVSKITNEPSHVAKLDIAVDKSGTAEARPLAKVPESVAPPEELQQIVPAKKKKLGKKERERLKAAKEREELERKALEETERAAKAAARLTAAPISRDRPAAQSKRKSKKRRMHEAKAERIVHT